jgi:hypothetical protein
MTTITLNLPDDSVKELRKRAAELDLSVEQLLQLRVEDILAEPEDQFRRAMEYVLKKNSELYRRLR